MQEGGLGSRFRGEPAIVLAGDELEATFLPDLGLLGASLRYGGEELLALPGGLSRYREGNVVGLPLLAPWANRLDGWAYEIAGVQVDLHGLPLTDDGNGLPIHGTMTAQPGWKVERVGDAAMSASFDAASRADVMAAFPFPHELVVEATVERGSLDVATTIRPTGGRPVPVSFGYHPYFRLPRTPRSSWLLRLPDRRHVHLDARGIPSGGTDHEPEESNRLGSRTFDDLYALGEDRRLAIGSPRLTVEVEMETGYPYAEVFAPAEGRFVCLEPMTAPTNALQTGDCSLVEPGGSFTARFRVTPRAGS